ncbi:MAG TPA: SLC13 family permease, partial [Desulfobacteria bacterium]|nr:SLC13 family permease [Desulfobacteria bacterium]
MGVSRFSMATQLLYVTCASWGGKAFYYLVFLLNYYGGKRFMKPLRYGLFSLFFIVLFLIGSPAFAGHGSAGGPPKVVIEGGDTINVSGIVLDSHKEPINEANVTILVNGKEMEHVVTAHNGKYVARFQMEKGEVEKSTIEIKAYKASFKGATYTVHGSDLAQHGDHLYISEDMSLDRHLGPAFWISTVVFILAYVLIAFELLHRTVAAMLGAVIMLVISYTIGTINPEFHIFSFESAIFSIDMNVVFLLMGMMIIVGVLKHTGVFQYCAYVSYKLAKGNVFVLAVYLMLFTAFSSAFLDNVTTMLLLTGVAIEISISLGINPLHMLIPLVLASNVGGTATLIGDPPNIMIGSYAGLTFMAFVKALALICLVCMVALIVFTKLVWGKGLAAGKVEDVQEYIAVLKEKYQITDPRLLTYGLAVLGFVIFLFLSHGYWHMEVSVAALMGGAVLLTIAILTEKVDLIELIEKDIEWPTLMFFIFLFIMVGAVETSGLLA